MIETFDLGILDIFQQMHHDVFTGIFRFFTVIGEGGAIWIAVAVLLLCFQKTRKIGIMLALALILCLVCGNGVLKHLIARERPCWRYPEVEMLIAIPRDYSFPSGHTFSSFASAWILLYWNRKYGMMALVAACIIAASRMYFFVHYPTDILGGILLGTLLAGMSIRIVEKIYAKQRK